MINLFIMNNRINRKAGKIRTVSVNDRGQLVIPEDIRKDLGITGETTLVLIEKDGDLMLKKESDVFDMFYEEDFWKVIANKSLEDAWDKEDGVWDAIAQKQGL